MFGCIPALQMCMFVCVLLSICWEDESTLAHTFSALRKGHRKTNQHWRIHSVHYGKVTGRRINIGAYIQCITQCGTCSHFTRFEFCTVLHESGLNESGLNESGLNESGLNESGLNESGLNESGLNESGLNESGLNESGLNES
jgi:hypothetical protein